MEINGLPLHPLAVHGAVVLAPLAALVALAYLRPVWRDRLRWPMVVTAVLAVVAVVVAYLSGDHFREANAFFGDDSLPATHQIEEHEELAGYLLWTTIGFGVLAVLNGLLHSPAARTRLLLGALLGIGAIAVVVLVALTGEAGARAVWGNGFQG
ncbi:MAG TPA: DUF2231 domain-containing protein [Nocardioides sp.]|nr:DUF2231 domain-containing protein [Nocardioides sp.]